MTPDAQHADILIPDYSRIVSRVEAGSRVLDLGCGKGDLLLRLVKERGVKGMGVEIDENAVIECIHKGLSVFQGDLDEGLSDYGDESYDYVILDQTLQVIRRPELVIAEMLRVGKKAIVSFPNFGHWKVRWKLLWSGHMPRTPKLPFYWYNTPNIHLLTISDFVAFCRAQKIYILEEIDLVQAQDRDPKIIRWGANWRADEGLFVLSRTRQGHAQ
ncbi:MAG: methionine biosynthesis protein MetW [Candidatus Firestonebacteria bacterium]|nr:methionine biosynthesis protein MetW [Candidatus Firestonebacteria bacterium]